MEKLVSKIDSTQTYYVRQKVLRPGKPIDSAHFDGDELQTTHHFGFSISDKIVAVLSLYNNRNALFDELSQFQLRGMAVLPEYQNRNIGNQLLDFAEDYAKNLNIELIWCNARESAVGFYSARSYHISGDIFPIADVGEHYVMYKKIQ